MIITKSTIQTIVKIRCYFRQRNKNNGREQSGQNKTARRMAIDPIA